MISPKNFTLKGGVFYFRKHACRDTSFPGPFSTSCKALQIDCSKVVSSMGMSSWMRLSLQITSFRKPSTSGLTIPEGTGVTMLTQ